MFLTGNSKFITNALLYNSFLIGKAENTAKSCNNQETNVFGKFSRVILCKFCRLPSISHLHADIYYEICFELSDMVVRQKRVNVAYLDSFQPVSVVIIHFVEVVAHSFDLSLIHI